MEQRNQCDRLLILVLVISRLPFRHTKSLGPDPEYVVFLVLTSVLSIKKLLPFCILVNVDQFGLNPA